MRERHWLVIRAAMVPISFRLARRVPATLVALLICIVGVVVASLSLGEVAVPPWEAFGMVVGRDAEGVALVVNVLRLPRTFVAVAAGMALGASGTILQGVTRNPLAAPGIVGITQGASLAVVTTVVVFPQISSAPLPLIALGGAAAVAMLIYLIAWRGAHSPERLILIGVGVAFVGHALTMAVIALGDIHRVASALVWMVGSVHARGWEELRALLPWLAVCLPLALLRVGALNVLSLGDDVAQGLGSHVNRERGLLLLTSLALAGAAVAAAGAIGFVGLMAPHLARRLVGPAHEGALPAAVLIGGLLVLGADLVGRTVVAPVEIPCGIVTALLGAPFFGYLLYRGGGK